MYISMAPIPRGQQFSKRSCTDQSQLEDQSKVSQLANAIVRDEDIVWLDVQVNEFMVMKVLQALPPIEKNKNGSKCECC